MRTANVAAGPHRAYCTLVLHLVVLAGRIGNVPPAPNALRSISYETGTPSGLRPPQGWRPLTLRQWLEVEANAQAEQLLLRGIVQDRIRVIQELIFHEHAELRIQVIIGTCDDLPGETVLR